MIQGRIDPHVHCRDGRQSYKSTIERIFQIADEQEVWMIFDMPNTNPPITTRGDVKERLKLVPPSCKDRYRLYVGITSDSEQIVEAVKCHQEFEEVIGLRRESVPLPGDAVQPVESADRLKRIAYTDFHAVPYGFSDISLRAVP